MIVKDFPNQQFNSKEAIFKALKDNKEVLIAQKKNIIKQADAVIFQAEVNKPTKEEGNKSEEKSESEEIDRLKAYLVINTTNLLDSHGDVHMKGLWNKSVKEQKNILLLQEHHMSFDKIISDKVKAQVKTYQWKDLGVSLQGETEALVFDSEINRERNPFMFEQYKKGHVKEHSVGMRYIKLELAINSDEKYYKEEKEIWDKYISEVANKEEAEKQGYFWVVLEAKIIEGSAVVKGSNPVTPTLSVEAVKSTTTDNVEPSKDTQPLKEEPKFKYNPNLY